VSGFSGLHRFGRLLVPQKLRWIAFSALLRCRPIRPEGAADQPGQRVFLVGFFSRISGAASVARAFQRHFAAAGRPHIPVDLGGILDHGLPLPEAGRFATPLELRRNASARGPGTVLVIMDAAYSPLPLLLLGGRFRRSKKLVALWFWELPDVPRSWRWSARCFDEIWTFSRFNYAAVRAVSDTVKLVDLPMDAAAPRSRRFAEDKLRLLLIFNMSANFARKNPLAAVEAFSLAFGDSDRAELLIKVTEGERFPDGMARLRTACERSGNVVLHERPFSDEAVHGLFAQSDIYLSLHRSEGLGQPLLEAIRHGLYVVATGWSGNVEFMQGRERCILVPYELVPVVDPQGTYPRTAQRADPDVDAAARALREIARTELGAGADDLFPAGARSGPSGDQR
jgi:glycosyltransferase involved in cell wall biosynthesis